MTVPKELFNGLPVDKVCSCGEHLQFLPTPSGRLAPMCIEHNVNHFTDCPDRARYKRTEPYKQARL